MFFISVNFYFAESLYARLHIHKIGLLPCRSQYENIHHNRESGNMGVEESNKSCMIENCL